MNLIILGPQGSGKGTQAKLLAEKYGLKHISTGALLREEVAKGTDKGKEIAKIMNSGALMSFPIMVEVIDPSLQKAKDGFILDGTPRDPQQSDHLDKLFKERGIVIDRVIVINISKEESLRRLQLRSKTEHRADDTPEAIVERLNLYQNTTLPVIEKFKQQGLVIEIDGTPDIQTIFQDIVSKLEAKK